MYSTEATSTNVACADRIFREHYDSVYRLAVSMTGSPADAEDIAQETFINVLRALPKFRGDAKLSTWIYRIAFRVAVRSLAKRRPSTELPDDIAASDQTLPLDLINALAKLPLRQRLVVLLVSVEGLSHDEAGDVLAIPPGTVASRLHTAREKLRRLL